MDDPSPRSHLSILILFVQLLFAKPTSADNTNFDFATFSLRNLTLLGDSYLRNGSIGLTRETDVPSSSSGTAACNFPIMFHDPRTNVSASFSTEFTFSITNPSNPSSSGDGMAFFLSSEKFNLGNTGGFLGLFNSSTVGNASKPIVAVEFDTRVDEGFGDVSSNHVGFDVGGPWSMNATDLGDLGIDLRKGSLITAWVEYDNTVKMVSVWLNYSGVNKPETPVLAVNYDLSKHFDDYMYVGFSASKEGSTEVHNIEEWTFQTSGFTIDPNVSSLVPRSNSSSESSWTVMPSLSVSSSDYTLHKKLRLGLGIAGPIAFCMFFIVIVWGLLIKKKFNNGTDKVDAVIVVDGPRKFSYKELTIATRGFHCGRVLGNGSFGTVYRAIQPGSCITYAVKRSKHSHQSKNEFMAELSIIARLRHKNLVQLQGWCDEKGELLIIYEFMPNGSLDKVLYHKGTESDRSSSISSSSTMFKWAQRYNAAVGIASVIMYLHEECEQQVIHRDIKTSNIMLDVNFNPRLGDFGLARLMEHNESPVSTLTAGTLGYLAPEYVQYGKATEKTDVFSFGVVVLEVCCGRRPIEKDDGSNNLVNLVDWVWFLYANDRLIEAADPRLHSEFNREEMIRLLMVGLSCANPDCEARPSMRKVIQILNFEMEPVQVPRLKPCLTFSLSLPRSLHDIVSDGEEEESSSSGGGNTSRQQPFAGGEEKLNTDDDADLPDD